MPLSDRQIRPLTATDVTAFGAIIAQIKRAEMGAERDYATLAAAEAAELASDLRGTQTRGFVAEVGGSLVGGAIIVPHEGATCELRALYLRTDARGLGMGRGLVSSCLDAARQLRFARCYLETMNRLQVARALYHSFGFVELPQPLRAVPDYVDLWLEITL